MSRTILVTGGSGFIGSYVLRLLAERGDTIINFDIHELSPETAWLLKPVIDHITFAKGSIDSWPAVVAAMKTHQPDTIIHIAAVVDLALLSRRPDLALNVNFVGTFNTLEAARLFDVKRFIYFSSRTVLPSVQYEPVDVNHPLLLATEGTAADFYSASKVACEAFCWAYRQSFGLDFIILRPTAVYGLGRQDRIPLKQMVENSVQGLPTRIEKVFPYAAETYVADVAQLTVRAMDIPADQVRDRVFYGGTGQPLVTVEQAAEIVKNLIPDADIEVVPGQSIGRWAKLGVLSIHNAQEQLGYQPRFADHRDGLADYIRTCRRYLSETT